MNTLPGTDNATVYEYWLLDASSRVLGHDSLADKIIARDFIPQKHPGLTIQTSIPLPQPAHREGSQSLTCKATFHKNLSLPFPLPDMEIVPGESGLIALRQMEGGQCWMGSPREGDDIYFDSEKISDRERFLPLSKKGFIGLSCLCERRLVQLTTLTGERIPPAILLIEPAHHLALGGHNIPLASNIEQLEQISHFLPGEEHLITLKERENHASSQSFLIQRIG